METRERAPRLSGFDYRRAQWYNITMVTGDRVPWLAWVEPDRVALTAAGLIARRIWLERPLWFPGVQLDEFAVMPDHIHAILALPGHGVSLDRVVGTFKTATSRAVVGIVGRRKLWQRSFWDRIVRNEAELRRFRNYVRDNPRRAVVAMGRPASRGT